MPKPKKPSVADQFSDDDMNKIKHYGQMLGGGVTPFDEAVEEALNKREANEEASSKKMHAAQTGGASLGPSQMDQAAIKQRGALQQQAEAQAQAQAAQAQGAQTSAEPPPAPAGPQGSTIPYSTQKGEVGGPGNAPQAQAPPSPPPAAPDGGPPPDEGEEEQGPPQ